MANWLCQLVNALEDRVERIELTLDRLNINTGQHATFRGSNYEISERQIAQWVAGTTLPLDATSSYVRFKDGNLEIRGGKFDIHTGEAGAHMEMDGSGLQGYNAADVQTIDLDWTAGNLWAKKGGFGNTKAAPLIVLNEDGTATIAGWDIDSTTLSKNNVVLGSLGYIRVGTGDDIVKMDATDVTWRLWAGDSTAADAPFRVDKDGNLVATSATITGTITATAGNIGGWTIDADEIKKLTDTVGITLLSTTPAIKVGDTDGIHILLDGANGQVGVSNFSAGAVGWRVEEDGDAEFNNINARGVFRTPVFLKEEVSSIGGTFLVSESAALTANCTTAAAINGSFTFYTEQNYFSVDDFVRCKPGATKQFWAKITNVAYDAESGTFEHTADLKNGDTSTTFEKGTAVVNYGASGQGLVQLTATLANSPYINIFTHAGSPWTTTTERARLGKLDGITDAEFGALTGYGLWTDNGYFTGSIKATAGELQTLDIADRLTVATDGEVYSANKYLIDQDGFFIEQGASAIIQFVENVEAGTMDNVGALFSYTVAGVNYTEVLAEGSSSSADAVAQIHAKNEAETLEWYVDISTSADMFRVFRNGNSVFWIDLNEDVTIPRGRLYVRQGAIINDDGLDSDTRIEGQTDANLFYVDASTNRVGIGTNAPQKLLDVDGDMWVDGSVYLDSSDIVAAGRTAADKTVYVDFVNGNDITGDGTSGSPYATLMHVINNVLPAVIPNNITICLSGGENQETSEFFGGFSVTGWVRVYARDTDDNDLYAQGTVTSGTNNTITDSGASWATNVFTGGYVWIYEGTGAGQIREIASNTGISITTTTNWTTNPDATSYYVVGGVVRIKAPSGTSFQEQVGLGWYGVGFIPAGAGLNENFAIRNTDPLSGANYRYCYFETGKFANAEINFTGSVHWCWFEITGIGDSGIWTTQDSSLTISRTVFHDATGTSNYGLLFRLPNHCPYPCTQRCN